MDWENVDILHHVISSLFRHLGRELNFALKSCNIINAPTFSNQTKASFTTFNKNMLIINNTFEGVMLKTQTSAFLKFQKHGAYKEDLIGYSSYAVRNTSWDLTSPMAVSQHEL